jgi:hypothetical protein
MTETQAEQFALFIKTTQIEQSDPGPTVGEAWEKWRASAHGE